MILENQITEIQTGIRKGRFINEAAVSQGIVLRLLGALSWPTFDTEMVSPEYTVEASTWALPSAIAVSPWCS